MFLNVLHNEVQKISRRRLAILILVITAVILLMTLGEYYTGQQQTWQAKTQAQIADYQRIQAGQPPAEWEGKLPTPAEAALQIQVLEHHLDQNLPVNGQDGGWFVADTVNKEMFLLLVLLTAFVAAEFLAQEAGEGTIKLLLVSPVTRTQVVLDKYLAVMVTVTLGLAYAAVLGYAVDGMLYGWGHLGQPVILAPGIAGTQIVWATAKSVPLWLYLLWGLGLNWLALACVSALGLLYSTLVNNSGAAIGLAIGTVVGGQVAHSVLAKANWMRYLFWSHLQPAADLPLDTSYVSALFSGGGTASVSFPAFVLVLWTVAFLLAAIAIYRRRDILV